MGRPGGVMKVLVVWLVGVRAGIMMMFFPSSLETQKTNCGCKFVHVM